VANPFPTGTFTPQDTPGFARRDNAQISRAEKQSEAALFVVGCI